MILKPQDENWTCPNINLDVDDILKHIFDYNNITFVQTDSVGAQLAADPYRFFAVNIVNLIKPISKNTINKYASVSYECVLTIAKPAEPSREVATGSVEGQFDSITKEFLSKEFSNTFRSYFVCCGYKITINSIRPIWNSTKAVKNINHSGVEINLIIEV